MLCTYFPPKRRIISQSDDGTLIPRSADYALLKRELLRASAEAESIGRYTPSTTVAVLDKLLEKGHLTPEEYLDLLPDGVLKNRRSVLEKISVKGA
jgi:hypothetical protein